MQLFNPCGFLENLDKNDQPFKNCCYIYHYAILSQQLGFSFFVFIQLEQI